MADTFEAVLDLSSKGLGCKIAGGADDGTQGVYVVEVRPEGAAAAAGIQANDQLMALNGESLEGLSHEAVVGRLAALQGSATLLVTRTKDLVINIDDSVPNESSTDAAAVVVQTSQTSEDRAALARKAFEEGDVEASKAAHEIPAEKHNAEAGAFVKAAVFGGLDGIITTFAVVASVAGADLGVDVVIIMGFANLIADGVSMGFGEYMSMSAELNHIEVERRRELWELENNPEGELKEMIEIYEEKGFTNEEAVTILTIMARHKDFFLEHMMVQELGLMLPDENDSPIKQGLVMFLSFMTFGFIPLLAYVALGPIDWPGSFDPTFLIACLLTALSLFVLGAAKSKFSTMSWWRSGLWVFINGAIAAAAAYLVGFALSHIVDTECA